MDLKGKFKTFIDQKKSQKKPASHMFLSAADDLSMHEFEGKLAVTAFDSRSNSLSEEIVLTKEAEDVLIGTVEDIYFDPNGSDTGAYELERFPDISDIHVITGIRSRLRKQLTIVSKRVSSLIMDKQLECIEEMNRISKLQKEACLAVALCVESRNRLAIGKNSFTSPSIHIAANSQKRLKILTVIKSLKSIRTLQMTYVQLQSMLQTGDYLGAIQLLLECQTATANFKHFDCISQLSSRLQDTLKIAEEQLDNALSNVVVNFNSNKYIKLHIAFSLLNKQETLMDQLHLHLTSHIHNSAFNVVLGYVELYNSVNNLNISSTLNDSKVNSSFSKMKYSDLCKCINSECFLPCYLDLCKSLWRLHRNYEIILNWHLDNKMDKDSLLSDLSEEYASYYKQIFNQNTGGESNERKENYVTERLTHGLKRLWQDIQAKVRTFILAFDMSHFKFDDFLKVLSITNKLMQIGYQSCESSSDVLEEAIKIQTSKFFHQEHLAKMEELHMFLENEAWHAVPLKPTFNIYQLIEYKFLKTVDVNSRSSNAVNSESSIYLDETMTPFDACMDEEDSSTEEDILASSGALSDEDTDEETDISNYIDDADICDNNFIKSKHQKRTDYQTKVPVVTNTSLAILRLVGKYLYMMNLLKPIASEVFACLSQLIHCYLSTICNSFGLRSSGGLSTRLSGLLQRISRENMEREGVSAVTKREESPAALMGIVQRVMACESLSLLLQELFSMRKHPVISSILTNSDSMTHRVNLFYSTLSDVLPEVTEGVYSCIAVSALPQNSLLSKMSAVSWSIKDLESIHNSYVDDIVSYLKEFSKSLTEAHTHHPLPPTSVTSLWKCLVVCVHEVLLQGYASAKACSNEGRSLMQLDYQQLTSKLEPLSGLRPLPGKEVVEGFIKAFYLPEGAVKDWVKTHRVEYTQKQMLALVNVMGHLPKREKSALTEYIVSEST